MIRLVLLLLLISVVAAIFGFTGIAHATAGAAKVVFFVFIALFLFALIMVFAGRK